MGSEMCIRDSTNRLMAGSDLPESIDAELGKILSMDIPREDKENILWRTARRLLDGEEG